MSFSLTERRATFLSLLSRMLLLKEAVDTKKITAQELATIGTFSSFNKIIAQENKDIDANNAELKNLQEKLLEILTLKEHLKEIEIEDEGRVLNALEAFEKKFSTSLSLLPLAETSIENFRGNLGDFAVFYNLFIQYLTISSSETIEFDLTNAELYWDNYDLKSLVELQDSEEEASSIPHLDFNIIKSQPAELKQSIENFFENLKQNTLLEGYLLNSSVLSNEQIEIVKDEIEKHSLFYIFSTDEKDERLHPYLEAVTAKKNILNHFYDGDYKGDGNWDELFKIILFSSSQNLQKNDELNTNLRELGVFGIQKMFEFIANNNDLFSNEHDTYRSFSTGNLLKLKVDSPLVDSLALFSMLNAHFTSRGPFTPFKRFTFALNFKKIEVEEFLNELEELLTHLEGSEVETIELQIESYEDLPEKLIDGLIKLAEDKKVTSFINIQALNKAPPKVLEKIQHLGNGIAKNRRRLLDATAFKHDSPTIQESELGKIGRAIFAKEELGSLASEVQVQQQQQQQVQQQMQTVHENEALADEDELAEEIFPVFNRPEECLNREQFIRELGRLIPKRYPTLSPEACWSLLVGGEHSEGFKYGIKKMTRRAAIHLLTHLEDFQFGLNPDNLPQGYFLAQDQDSIVLSYDAINYPPNPNVSALTPSVTVPKAANNWQGNALQFLSKEEADKLYNTVFKTGIRLFKKTISCETAINNFFNLRNVTVPLIPNLEQRLTILEAFSSGFVDSKGLELSKKIKNLFGKTLSAENIAAMVEILYEKGPDALNSFIAQLQQLKEVKGEAFFKSFKLCFIDPSVNLNELLTVESIAALEKLLTLSAAQSTWWLALTEQHSSNLAFSPDNGPGNRFANLASLTAAFSHFCDELDEIKPGLVLTSYCPLTGVKDMYVGLDRLLVILANAHNVDEQFFGSLDGLSLNGLGPFYASRYEGFKLVHPQMRLSLGDLELPENPSTHIKSELRNNEKIGEENCAFRVSKESISSGLGSTLPIGVSNQLRTPQEKALWQVIKNKKLAYWLRYIATFNHRASLAQYQALFERCTSEDFPVLDQAEYPNLVDNILVTVALCTTGQQGKNFTEDESQEFFEFIRTIALDPDLKKLQKLNGILGRWQGLRRTSIKPTLNQVTAISKAVFKENDNIMRSIGDLCGYFYKENAQIFIESLTILAKNRQGFSFSVVIDALKIIEDMFKPQNEIKPLYFENDTLLRVMISKLLAVCSRGPSEDVSIDEDVKKLYSILNDCEEKHGKETTYDLVEILANIDVENSPELPPLNRLIEVIGSITQANKPSFNQLLEQVQEELPQVVLNLNQVVAPLNAVPVSLENIMAQEMPAILESLKPFQAMMPDLYEKLKGPEGAALLVNNLAQLKKMPALVRNPIEEKIQAIMKGFYKNKLRQGLAAIAVKGNLQLLLERIIRKQMVHPSLDPDIKFDSFCERFPKDLESLQVLLHALNSINKHWPADFDKVVSELGNAPGLMTTSPEYLAKITTVLNANFSPSQPFPISTLKQLLSAKAVPIEKVGPILEAIFEPELQEKWRFKDREKELLCELALNYNSANAKVSSYLERLCLLKETEPELYLTKLLLLRNQPQADEKVRIINKAIKDLSAVLEPKELLRKALDFYLEKPENFFPFIAIIETTREKNRAAILKIVVKAALMDKENYDNREINHLVRDLGGLSEKNIDRLSALYDNFRVPTITELSGTLISHSVNFEALEATFDRDPFGKRSDPNILSEHFDSSGYETVIDKMCDLNYQRPLLFSQRQELQEWFLYINAIGNRHPIQTMPDSLANSKAKVVKDLSRQEIAHLVDYYHDFIKRADVSESDIIKAKLEYLAIMREVMYRTTGLFPYSTQLLYVLYQIQNKGDLGAQIQTGEGKSLIAALTAGMSNLEGKTVDVATKDLFLAQEGFDRHKSFFDYLKVPVNFITLSAKAKDFNQGGVRYSSVADLSLARSKLELAGEKFSKKDSVIILDEADFVIQDDSTRKRNAISLENSDNPYESAYRWIYEALIDFVAAQKEYKTDQVFKIKAQEWVRNSAKNKQERKILNGLEEHPDFYQKKLEGWLMAASRTAQLVQKEEKKFRVVELEHKKFGKVSKACILVNGRPDIEAEFSDSIQQFLHLRLQKQYSEQIAKGERAPFLIEPENTYITSVNNKILANSYERRLLMSGTLGSLKEIKEQQQKYGLKFVDIPPHLESARQDLAPILTHSSGLSDLEKEERDHLNKIVKETLRVINRSAKGVKTNPILILCKDKKEGERIEEALRDALIKNSKKYKEKYDQIQSYYSSEKSTPAERNEEEKSYVEKAGLAGMITISSVFDRGTDIKITHPKGLSVLQTYIDTQPHSIEDLERAKRQKIGRAGRKGQYGETRLIIKRSEFADVYTVKEMKKIPSTVKGVDKAISDLNKLRYQARQKERTLRESFDDIKQLIYKEFFKYLNVINKSGPSLPKKEIREYLLQEWNKLLQDIDEYWEELQDPDSEKLEKMKHFAWEQWNQSIAAESPIKVALAKWSAEHHLNLELPQPKIGSFEAFLNALQPKVSKLDRGYISHKQLDEQIDSRVSEDQAYCNFTKPTAANEVQLNVLRFKTAEFQFKKLKDKLTTSAHKAKLADKFKFSSSAGLILAEEILGALLYLRYLASKNNNPVAYASLGRDYRKMVTIALWSNHEGLKNAVINAQRKHFEALKKHQGSNEAGKAVYLQTFMAMVAQEMPSEANQWKPDNFSLWWSNFDKDRTLNQLLAYRDNWWSRSWVSSDRKKIVTTLIESLEKVSQTPTTIMEALTKARFDLLADDSKKGRSLAAGLEGRLYHYIDEARKRIISACAPTELDALVKNEFSDIRNVLGVFNERLKLPLCTKLFEDFNSAQLAANPLDKEVVRQQYRSLISFFAKIEVRAQKKPVSDDLKKLASYCQEKSKELVYYFAQCEQLLSLNKQGSIEVYRAASAAVATVVERINKQAPVKSYSVMPVGDFLFKKGHILQFETSGVENKVLEESAFFKKINNPASYQSLLAEIEQRIVESRAQPTLVKFNTLRLCTRKREHFDLNIELTVAGVPTTINYRFNAKTEKVYTEFRASSLFELQEKFKALLSKQFNQPAYGFFKAENKDSKGIEALEQQVKAYESFVKQKCESRKLGSELTFYQEELLGIRALLEDIKANKSVENAPILPPRL